jgi:glycosyltransferase involved in cell wall biosynthesis
MLLFRFSGLPKLTESDLFIFADILDDAHKLNAYRTLIQTSGVHVAFYCHDVIPLKFKCFVTEKLHEEFRRMIELFSGPKITTICNSRATSDDLQNVRAKMGLSGKAPILLSPGCDLRPDTKSARKSSEGEIPATKYLLYVSTVEIRKNHKVLLEAYDILTAGDAFDPPRLIFVGQRGWLVDELLHSIDERRGTASYVTLMTNVSDADLANLYRGALFTLYPSLYEGWGIPVVEALYYGKFCICSDRGALAEAGGEFAEYLDPGNSELWARRIKHYLGHPEELLERECRIRKDFRPRLWSDFRQEASCAFLRAGQRESSTRKEDRWPHLERDLS